MGVSRPSLREAISDLQNRNLLTSKANSGIFVAEFLGSAFSPALTHLFSAHDEAVLDYLTFRRDLEGLAAERAAEHATETDLKVIQTIFDKMTTAYEKRDPADEALLDAEFHLAIIDASHNIVMLHMMRSMFQLLREGVFYNRQIMFKQRTTRTSLLNQHGAINDALQNRDAAGARKAVEEHLDFVKKSLLDNKQAEKHEKIAQLRIQHHQK